MQCGEWYIMTNEITSVPKIVDRWPSRSCLAKDLGVDPIVVARWVSRNSIPAKYHFKIVNCAKRRGLKLRFEDLARAHSSLA